MNYEISNDLWHKCKLCGQDIKEIARTYGKSGKYYTYSFKKHLEINHDICLEDYFSQLSNQPKCMCGICNKKSKISIKGSRFQWKKYMCGRYPGTLEWSNRAKIDRLGNNNPMFNKEPWNKGLNKNNNTSLMSVSIKQSNRKVSQKTKEKQSISAKNRKIHGHTGYKHSDTTKQKCRDATLKRIKEGKFKQTKTKPHLEFSLILQKLDIEYIEEKIVDCWSFDFYIPDIGTYIEIDGDYFHSNPKIYPNGPKTKTQKINYYRDCKKNDYCIKNNIKLIRFWESDVLNNGEEII